MLAGFRILLARRRRGGGRLAKSFYLPPFLGLRHDGVHYQVRISLSVPRMRQLDLHILPKRFRRQPLHQSLRDCFGRSGMIFSVRVATNCLEFGVVGEKLLQARMGSTLSISVFPLVSMATASAMAEDVADNSTSCPSPLPSMALNHNYKLRRRNSARFMVHASKTFLHVTRNKLRHRHHLTLYSASCISM